MKTDLNAGIFESVFIVESDRASFKLQNDTKIDLLANFLSGDMFEGTLRRYCNALLSKRLDN